MARIIFELGPMVSTFTGFGPDRIATRITRKNVASHGVLRRLNGEVVYAHVTRECWPRDADDETTGPRRHWVSFVKLLPDRKTEGLGEGDEEGDGPAFTLADAIRLANDITAGPLAGATPLGPEGLAGTGWEGLRGQYWVVSGVNRGRSGNHAS